MSLQVTLGRGALVALGCGPSDIVTLYNLGKKFGNWLTATEDDTKLLQILDSDEVDVLRRQGVMDLDAFKRSWNNDITVLVQGDLRRGSTSNSEIKVALDNLTRFTACMLTVIAALDAFLQQSAVKAIMRVFLNALFSTTSDMELTLSTEIDSRINAWRSAACVRGLHLRMREIRAELIRDGVVQEGFVPTSECQEIVAFLQWLLGETSGEMTTASSDVTGIGICLGRTAFDLLRVALPGHERFPAPCTLVYDNTKVIRSEAGAPNFALEGQLAHRRAKISVPVDRPHEAMSSFPISDEDGNHCRAAWKSGQRCGDIIELKLRRSTQIDINDGNDLSYDILDHGKACGRVDDEVFAIVALQAFSANEEICDSLTALLRDSNASKEDQQWLLVQLRDTPTWNYTVRQQQDGRANLERVGPELGPGVDPRSLHIQDMRMKDDRRIFLFTLVQAFFLGYYYSIVFQIVDTRKLLRRVVDGAFSFRSPTFLKYLQDFTRGDMPVPRAERPLVGRMSRQRLFEMLPCFLFSLQIKVDHTRRDQWLIGMIGERALLASSIISPTVTPAAISKFTLLDADVSSIPRVRDGAVISGSPQAMAWSFGHALNAVPTRVQDCGPAEDFTMHIEADWDANVDHTVICVRYKGRRIGAYHPLVAEKLFLMAYVDPVASPKPAQLDQAATCTVEDILKSTISFNTACPVLVQAKGNPCMRYAMVALSNSTSCKVASNCVQTAAKHLPRGRRNGQVGLIVIGSEK